MKQIIDEMKQQSGSNMVELPSLVAEACRRNNDVASVVAEVMARTQGRANPSFVTTLAQRTLTALHGKDRVPLTDASSSQATPEATTHATAISEVLENWRPGTGIGDWLTVGKHDHMCWVGRNISVKDVKDKIAESLKKLAEATP